MKKILNWVIPNTCLAVLMYLGFVEQVTGAVNVAIAYAWVLVGVSVLFSLVVSSDDGKDLIKEKMTKFEPSINRSVDIAFDILVVATFVWFECFVIGIMYFIHIFLMSYVITEMTKVLSDEVE